MTHHYTRESKFARCVKINIALENTVGNLWYCPEYSGHKGERKVKAAIILIQNEIASLRNGDTLSFDHNALAELGDALDLLRGAA